MCRKKVKLKLMQLRWHTRWKWSQKTNISVWFSKINGILTYFVAREMCNMTSSVLQKWKNPFISRTLGEDASLCELLNYICKGKKRKLSAKNLNGVVYREKNLPSISHDLLVTNICNVCLWMYKFLIYFTCT